MRIRLIIPAVLLASGLLAGQEKPAPEKAVQDKPGEAYEAAVITVKTLSGESFNRLSSLLTVFGAKYTSSERLRTIVVYAPKDVVTQMRRVIEQLDQPGSEAVIGRNLEVSLAFLRCSVTPQPDTRPLPADLEGVAKQLRAVTQYKDIQLWDVVPVHVQEGREVSHSLRLSAPMAKVPNAFPTASIRMLAEGVTRKDSGRYVRFERMHIGFKIPYLNTPFVGNDGKSAFPPQVSYMDVGLNTAGDFKEGQKTVLGKISGVDEESAVFVVVSLKVLD